MPTLVDVVRVLEELRDEVRALRVRLEVPRQPDAGSRAFCAACGATRSVDARCVGCGSILGEYEKEETP